MTEWHADVGLLERWAQGQAAMPEATSLEQHLLGCPECRALVHACVSASRPRTVPDPEAVWSRLRDEIEVSRPTAVERVFRRAGLSPNDARLIAEAPMFRAEWASALLAVLIFSTFAAFLGQSRGMWLFLAVAPLVPGTAVALCYDPRIEPALEHELTTPYSTMRLVLLRTLAVLAGGLPVLLVLGLLVPGSEPVSLAASRGRVRRGRAGAFDGDDAAARGRADCCGVAERRFRGRAGRVTRRCVARALSRPVTWPRRS